MAPLRVRTNHSTRQGIGDNRTNKVAHSLHQEDLRIFQQEALSISQEGIHSTQLGGSTLLQLEALPSNEGLLHSSSQGLSMP